MHVHEVCVFVCAYAGICTHIQYIHAICGSPYVHTQIHKHKSIFTVHDQAGRQGLRVLMENKSKFIACHSSTGHKHSLKDVLSDPQIAMRLQDTVCAISSRARACEPYLQ